MALYEDEGPWCVSPSHYHSCCAFRSLKVLSLVSFVHGIRHSISLKFQVSCRKWTFLWPHSPFFFLWIILKKIVGDIFLVLQCRIGIFFLNLTHKYCPWKKQLKKKPKPCLDKVGWGRKTSRCGGKKKKNQDCKIILWAHNGAHGHRRRCIHTNEQFLWSIS